MTPPEPLLLGLPSQLLFPGDVSTIDVRRTENVRELARLAPDARVLVGALERPDAREEERLELVQPIATLARLVSRTHLVGGGMRIVLQGLRRARLEGLRVVEGCLWAVPVKLGRPDFDPEEARVGLERLAASLDALGAIAPEFVGELRELVPFEGQDVERVTDLVTSMLPLDYKQQAQLLGEVDPLARLTRLNRRLGERLLRARAEQRLDDELGGRVRRDVLLERLAVLKEELGEPDLTTRELERLRLKLGTVDLPESVRQTFQHELELSAHTTPGSPASARAQSRLEWALELPWTSAGPEDDRPFENVMHDLESSHVGLEGVKRRIAEILAIRQLGGGARGSVMCFQGPPGTGKSSMARAVAAALGRRLLTIPVGAVLSERELVGVSPLRDGASPGSILAGIHRTGASDPVVLLDEIDKLSLGGEGTAAGALLHLLDPEHNGEFFDHYLGVPFDLSRCLFLATANDLDEVPETLLDRMDVLPFEGYTEGEKYTIARSHLIPRAREHAGLETGELKISPGALRAIVRNYTEEAGVRHLSRLVVALARKAAVEVVKGGSGLDVKKADLFGLLGPRTAIEELRPGRPAVGLATGLAWTSVGGALLPIETLLMKGEGRATLTGQIGEVMRESVQTAISYLRSCTRRYGLQPGLFESIDLHLHFPSAAIPKDGPSAGIAIATALLSLVTGRPARHDVALTGELSLLGAVLPVGGLREKLLAAIRSGIPEVIVSVRNREDVQRLPAEIQGRVTIHLVGHADEAFELALAPERGRRRAGATAANGRTRRIARRVRPPER